MTLFSIVVLVVLCTVALRVLREPVLRGGAPRWLRPVYLWIFPPVGLYERVRVAAVDISSQASTRFEYSPKYVGVYEMGLIVDRNILMPKKSYDFGLTAVLSVDCGGKDLWTRVVGPDALPWWDANCNGFTLATFLVPDHIPLDGMCQFALEVSTPSRSFHPEYGNATIYIGKRAEK